MRPIRTTLIALAAVLCASGVQAQSESRDFASDRWSHFSVAFEVLTGVRGQSNEDDLLLLVCRERDTSLDFSFHAADQSGLSESAEATLVFDGTPAGIALRTVAILDNVLFILPDRDPNFERMVEKLTSAKTVEIAIALSGTEGRRHAFTLNGAAAAIAPAMQLCGR